MDRMIIFTQEQGRSVDILFGARAALIGLAKLSQAAFGANTVVRGLPVTPNSPAALNVLVGLGEIYSMADVDATAWGALPADTTDVIVKQGLNMAAQTISTPPPATSGFSVVYLIECQYQDQDTNAAVLPYYNSANPQEPLNGQGGLGAAQATQRQGFCVIQAKAGIAAATGTQVTPSVDSGWTALAVVTVANGATTVTSGNISVPAGVPQVTSLLQMMQTGSPVYAVDNSTTANQISLALTPAITAYTDGQEITFKAANNNTGPCTINAGPGSVNLVGAAGALQGGEIVAGSQYTAIYSASLGELVLNSQTGGAEQINPATKSQHTVQYSQILGKFARFSSSGSFTVPAAVTTIYVSGCGGGAGGGGGQGNSGGQSLGGGGGGGAGQNVIRSALTVTPGQVIAIGIGAAGTAGASGIAGTAGGNTTIGTLLTLTGGGAGMGGGNVNSNSIGGGGAGGVSSGFPAGGTGSDGNLTGNGGMGASGPFGGGGGNGRAATANGGVGSPASGFGSGGGGGGGAYGTTAGLGGAGGTGAAGLALIEW
jgi:hypothetical protein